MLQCFPIWFFFTFSLFFFQNCLCQFYFFHIELVNNLACSFFLKKNIVDCYSILSKTASFHTLFIKKKPETVPFWTALWVFFFPWRREEGEEEDFSSPCFHRLSSSEKHQKDADQGPPTCPKLSTCWRGGSTVATRSLSPLFFAYKNRGRESKKKERAEEGAQKSKREEEDRKKKRKKNRAEKRERRRRKGKKKTEEGEEEEAPRTTVPPATISSVVATATVARSTMSHRKQAFFPFPFFFFFVFFFFIGSRHCSRCMWTVERPTV